MIIVYNYVYMYIYTYDNEHLYSAKHNISRADTI